MDKTEREHLFFAKQVNRDTFISSGGKEVAAELKFFVLSTLGKHQHFLRRGPWSATSDPRELTFLKAD